ncbi:carboxymuconolactone decarboxylase family protein [Helicovermis profundi]|uniref:Carboxymuconolactone decarboxylase family protein n=1 Tax=Helicovermis profundi TaxID=3065157 RepID=A0AAU9E5G5_9FIRM|nr:carboxymuconolactone decarboxylase family protein [Clostridia bacterium S502]
METKDILKMIEKEMGAIPKPLKDLSELSDSILKGHVIAKKNAYSGENLDAKTKALIALAVGIALDSEGCIMNNVKEAKKLGATTAEIMEVYSIAKFSKSSSAISGFAPAMEWLINNKDEM